MMASSEKKEKSSQKKDITDFFQIKPKSSSITSRQSSEPVVTTSTQHFQIGPSIPSTSRQSLGDEMTGSETVEMESESESEILPGDLGEPKEKSFTEKKRKRQKFSLSWLDDARFKGWLEPVPESKSQAKCKACNLILGSKKSDLIKHSTSKRHTTKAAAVANVRSLDLTFHSAKTLDLQRKQIIADLKFAVLIASHNLSFRSVEHITEISKQIFSDSELSSRVAQKRTKCASIIKNVLAPVICEKLISEMRNKPISILVDESSDISNTRLICILVRYIHQGIIKTQLLDILKIEADEGTAKGLYSLFKKLVAKFNLDFANIVGYCSDNASVMMGNTESFKTYLLKDAPHVITSGCICHSAHLVAVAAADEIPSNVEALLHNLYSYFSRSPKRQSVLEELQRYFNKAQVKILGPSKTRWLALSRCVERVLEQWDVLVQIFRLAAFEDKNPVANIIFNELQNPYVKAYLYFFKYVLPVFNQFNAVFQSERVLIQVLSIESERFIRQLCGNFVQPECYKKEKLLDLNPFNPRILLPIEDIFVGPQTMNVIKDCDKTLQNQFKLQCLKFYQKAVADSLRRFPIKDNFFSHLTFLSPENALKSHLVDETSLYNFVLNKFKHLINPDVALLEFQRLKSYLLDAEINRLLEKAIKSSNVIDFWNEIKDFKNYNNEPLFENISNAALLILSLPHGNADVERAFSMMVDIKTKKRNRILPETLSALLRIKLDLHSKKQCCLTYQFEESHIEKFRKGLYQPTTAELDPESSDND